MKKGLIIAAAMILAVCLGIGGTLAYLFTQTNSVVNTFEYGDVNIDLTETVSGTTQSAATNKVENKNFKMIPGNTLTKDPKAIVKANSEDCWLFVKIDKSANFGDFMTFEIATGWTELEAGVYYREVSKSTADQPFSILQNDAVKVKEDVLKTQLNALVAANYPTLTFTAYAVQKANVANAAAAWAIANGN